MANAVPRLNIGAAVCLWYLLFSPLSAAVAQYHVDSWTTENGLPQNIVRDVCQTPDGYLWLATMDGLVRFDGVRFVVFNRSNTPEITGNRFTSLYCMATGEFWAGTETSGITRYRQGRFTTYTIRNGLPSNQVAAVSGDPAGHIWALSYHSIAYWDEASARFVEFSSERYRYFLGSTWFGWFDRGSGFWSIDRDRLWLFSQGRFLDYPLPANWPRRNLMGAYRDLNGALWLGASDGRLARLSQGQWSTIFHAGAKHTGSANMDNLISTYRDSRGDMFDFGIANEPGAGLVQWLNLSMRGRTQKILFNSVFEDREGSLWVATDGQGLYRLRKQAVSAFSKEEGLPDRNIYPIYQDRNGAIWIGTWNGGLVRYSGGKFTTFSTADGLSSLRVTSISETRDGTLWVATIAGLHAMQKGRFELVQNTALQGREGAQAIHQDPEGTLWVGTSRGLVRCQSGRWSVIGAKDGLASGDVRVMIDGRAGNLWIGGYGGLTSLDHGQFRHWTETDGLPSNNIRSLYEDRDGVLWIGTYDGGLGRLQDGRFTRYTVRDGLFNNGVFQILEDSRGYLWISSNRGIYRVSKSELNEFATGKRTVVSSTPFGRSEGMYNSECNGGYWPAGIRARDGRLWFPTQDGVAVIDPGAVTANSAAPPVVIESASLDNEPRALDRAIRVAPGSQNLDIEYTALSFINSGQMRFRYRLEGLDRDWVEAGTRRTAYYSNLPPGDYQFRVIAANSDGVWNLEGKTIPVIVLPPFYRTWWFLMLAAVVAAGGTVLAWKYRVARLERANALQHAFTRDLIASQESERKRIAAELRDSLGQRLVVIKNLALISLNDGASEGAPRPHVEEISVEASHALNEVREISYNLRPYQLDRIGLTKAIEAIVKKASAASSIAFTAAIDDIDEVFPKDSQINVYRIVQESVNNVIKHSQASEANVTLRRNADSILLMISDNGKGFTAGTAGRARNQSGFGLIGISERAQLLGGKLDVHSTSGRGTTISIHIDRGRMRHGT